MSDQHNFDQAASPDERARAARAVASAATDAQDCALLLDMLGLSVNRPIDAALPKRPAA